MDVVEKRKTGEHLAAKVVSIHFQVDLRRNLDLKGQLIEKKPIQES